ncbi:MAG: hypothetical protein HOO86_07400, partial [Bacteroidales bacterium]|nr:hypothetical protein [Bacteroidales bacterium]
MKYLKPIVLLLFPVLFGMITACSDRSGIPVSGADSTIVYPSKQEDGINAKIVLCRKYDKKTGIHIGLGTVFVIREKESVNAFVDLENRFVHSGRVLLFHFDWIGPDGKSIFLKRIDHSPTDSTTTINGSISISPEKREPGQYALKVYLFRELIAEKQFWLINESPSDTGLPGAIISKITFFGNKDKNTGELTSSDSTFTLGEKERVFASIELKNHRSYADGTLKFKLDWIGSDGESFYRKPIDLLLTDSASRLISSISISPKNRKTGKCLLRLYLFDELLNEQSFELRPEPVILPKRRVESITAKIQLYGKADKSAMLTGPDSVFVCGEKAKVYAMIKLENIRFSGKRELKFQVDWIGTN